MSLMLANMNQFEILFFLTNEAGTQSCWHNILYVLLKMVMMHQNDRQTFDILEDKLNFLECIAQISSAKKITSQVDLE